MIDPEYELPVTRQVELLDLSRSSVYYVPRPISDKDLELMRLIDELHLEYPFAGTRMLRDMLWHKGHHVGRQLFRWPRVLSIWLRLLTGSVDAFCPGACRSP
jgi:putative transposase